MWRTFGHLEWPQPSHWGATKVWECMWRSPANPRRCPPATAVGFWWEILNQQSLQKITSRTAAHISSRCIDYVLFIIHQLVSEVLWWRSWAVWGAWACIYYPLTGGGRSPLPKALPSKSMDQWQSSWCQRVNRNDRDIQPGMLSDRLEQWVHLLNITFIFSVWKNPRVSHGPNTLAGVGWTPIPQMFSC